MDDPRPPRTKITVDEERQLADLARFGYMRPDSPLVISIPQGEERDEIYAMLGRLMDAWRDGLSVIHHDVAGQTVLTVISSFWAGTVQELLNAQEGNPALIHTALVSAVGGIISHAEILHHRACTTPHEQLP